MKDDNFYKEMTWDFMLKKYPHEKKVNFILPKNSDKSCVTETSSYESGLDGFFDVEKYFSILSRDFPDFIREYSQVPSMQRLKGIGLLCGTDWTNLYKNRFKYSRFEHSIGVALIVWNWTKDKIQTLSALLHDIATPAFSHVQEFRKGDALTQSENESRTENIIRADKKLCMLLERDDIKIESVCDYHIYPVADNKLPGLCADRLEYMFPSGASLIGSWSIEEIKKVYEDIAVLKNEHGDDELGFKHIDVAEFYCQKFCEIGHILQLNENKLALQMLAEIVTRAIQLGIITDSDCMKLSEEQILCKFKVFCTNGEMFGFYDSQAEMFNRIFMTFLQMEKIVHSDEKPFDDDFGFCVSLDVKQRYINPLVELENSRLSCEFNDDFYEISEKESAKKITDEKNCGKRIVSKNFDEVNKKTARLFEVSKKANKIISDFLDFKDTKWGGVPLKNC